MDLLLVNGIGIPILLILVFISMCRVRNRRYCYFSSSIFDHLKNYAAKLLRRKDVINKHLPFTLGLCVTILLNHYVSWDIFNLPTNDERTETDLANVFQSSFDSSEKLNSSMTITSDSESKIWLVMSTTYSLTQPPNLIRIAQAIFPVRHFVTLVLVKNYPIRNGIEHLNDLDRLLRRFSISFVLLSSHQYKEYLRRSKLKLGLEEESALGLLTGITWVLQDVKRSGVLMTGHEEYTYKSDIFLQIRETVKLSSWPVAFGYDRPLTLGLTSPILGTDGRMEGYFDGDYPSWDTMPIQIGAFAVNIDYLRKNGSVNNAWKLAFDSIHNIGDLGFDLQDVQPLGNNCSKIFVWRTRCRPHAWPKAIKYKEYYKETNMDALMRSVFGVRFFDYVQAETNLMHYL